MHSSISYFYINLSHRLDRNKSILRQFSNFNITNYTRINAIKEQNGNIGCSKSHILALKQFIESKIDIGIFLEDDFKFTVSKEIYYSILNNIIDDYNLSWDVVLISGNVRHKEPYNKFLDRCFESQTASGYVVTQKFAKTLLANYEDGLEMLKNTGINSKYAIDQYWKILQKQYNWFITNPKCGEQAKSYSDIQKQFVYYGC